MKFKVLKEVGYKNYEITCLLPISLLDWNKLEEDIEKIKRVSKKDDSPDDLVVRLVLPEKFERKSIDWRAGVWNGFDGHKNFLTLHRILEIEEKFSEIQEKERETPKMYITVVPPKSGNFDR